MAAAVGVARRLEDLPICFPGLHLRLTRLQQEPPRAARRTISPPRRHSRSAYGLFAREPNVSVNLCVTTIANPTVGNGNLCCD